MPGMSACLGLGERQPDQFLQFLGRPAIRQLDRHAASPAGKEACVEAPHAAGRSYGAGDDSAALRGKGATPCSAKPCQLGLAVCERRLAADQQPRFLIGLADRRKRDGAGAGRAGRAGCGRFWPLRPDAGPGHGNAAVVRVRAAARKDELARHEGVPGVAAAHQHQDFAARVGRAASASRRRADATDPCRARCRAIRPCRFRSWSCRPCFPLAEHAWTAWNRAAGTGEGWASSTALHASGCLSKDRPSPPKPCI